MKNSFLILLSVVLFLSCKSGGNTNNADTTAMEGVTSNNSMDNTWDQAKIGEFVTEAATGGMMEVQLGQVAQKKALSQQVKDYGKMMEKDHSEASNQLKTAVQSLSLTIPAETDKSHQDKIAELNKKSGADFDKEYIDEMVKDHKDDVSKFEDAQKNLPSGELKTWVENTLPILRQHLIQAETLQDQLKNKK